MKLETFFEKFEQFADAPNTVAKMRELVLDLAVSRRLIPPKSEWTNRSLKSLATKIGSGATPAGGRESYFSEGIPLIRSMNVHFGGFNRTGLVFLSNEQAGQLSNVVVQPHDVLLNITGASIGRVTTAPLGMAGARVNQHVTIIRPTPELLPSYLTIFLSSPSIQRMIDEIQVGATRQALTKGMIEQFEIPLPSLAEQKRIVAKVDELMALCDRLEEQQQERDTRHAALARASLARFAEAPTPANLDFLFHPSYTISPADLRKSILTLAVQGKLVPQDPNDETADELITRIAEYRSAKKAKAYEPVAMEEAPYEVPFSWSWVRLGNISLTSDSGWSPQCLSEARSGTDWGVLKVSAVSWGVFKPEENKALPPGMIARSECEVKAGDFLLSRANTEELVARSVVVDQTPPRLMMSDKIVRFTFPDEIEKAFINLANSSEPARDYYARNASGTSSSMKNIGREVMCNLPIPLPPFAEQRRIVAKVDQLMALVDQLESQLAEAKSRSAALLEAIVHELLNPSAEVIDLASYRAAIGCYVIRKMGDKRYFGRVAAMKTLYLAEAHVGLHLGFQPEREAAGPLDHWIYRFEEEGKQKEWFKAVVENTTNGKTKVEYQPGKMLAAQAAQAETQLAQKQRKEFDRLLDLLSDKKTEEVEIIATLFAAWNDFLIDGHVPTDDEIVTEVRENWHERKERFTPTLLRQWLGWLRQNNLVPQGRLPHTVHQSKLSLN